MVDELHTAIASHTWILVADRANRIADAINSVVAQTEGMLDGDARAGLARAGHQFRTIAASADRGDGRANAASDAKRLRSVATAQKDQITKVVELLRGIARANNG
ncbi:hypothetical protein GI374_08680 [Paracoccus sp. S-4012]|uniref:hypothetical protein n=1 Tax=Paracoccus sp. S-4012 TaxID=2665648 RepID=UPI0012B1371B|nr:hypothetical protein [Paracoccus sp. S-4012]MRX50515.1 hypothetical protein [Paracoccus sp. S-4012]